MAGCTTAAQRTCLTGHCRPGGTLLPMSITTNLPFCPLSQRELVDAASGHGAPYCESRLASAIERDDIARFTPLGARHMEWRTATDGVFKVTDSRRRGSSHWGGRGARYLLDSGVRCGGRRGRVRRVGLGHKQRRRGGGDRWGGIWWVALDRPLGRGCGLCL